MDKSSADNARQVEAALQEANDDGVSVFTHTFKRPFQWEGKTFEQLDFDFTKLSGKDSLAVQNELSSKGIVVAVPTLSGPYLVRIAARACLVPLGVDAFEAMPIADFNRIQAKTRNFLLTSEQ